MEVFAKILAVGEVSEFTSSRNGNLENISKREIVLQTLETHQSQQGSFCGSQSFVATLFGQQALDFKGLTGGYCCAQLSFSATRNGDGSRWFQNVSVSRIAFPTDQQI